VNNTVESNVWRSQHAVWFGLLLIGPVLVTVVYDVRVRADDGREPARARMWSSGGSFVTAAKEK
jgi:hypothetical protein